ncbi:MAG TPA: hypothetical protein VKY26_06880 [Actinomycetota bacterium]|nr:hypothetical protein [Actinomycetota bacterium]
MQGRRSWLALAVGLTALLTAGPARAAHLPGQPSPNFPRSDAPFPSTPARVPQGASGNLVAVVPAYPLLIRTTPSGGSNGLRIKLTRSGGCAVIGGVPGVQVAVDQSPLPVTVSVRCLRGPGSPVSPGGPPGRPELTVIWTAG